MGIKAAYEWFMDRVYPAPVAPFVEMVASAIEKYPSEFSLVMDPHFGAVSVRVLDTAKGVERELVDNGIGLDINFNSGDVLIVSYYLDAIPVNWRESRRLVGAVESMLDALEDARKLAATAAANDDSFGDDRYNAFGVHAHTHMVGMGDPAHNHPPGVYDQPHVHTAHLEARRA